MNVQEDIMVIHLLRKGAVAELWTQEWDYGSGESRIEYWLNGGCEAF